MGNKNSRNNNIKEDNNSMNYNRIDYINTTINNIFEAKIIQILILIKLTKLWIIISQKETIILIIL